MGYTRCWNVNENELSKGFSPLFINRVKKIVDEAQNKGIIIRNWEGIGEPEINEEIISINGNYYEGLDHESFTISSKNSKPWGCKTARKPYDAVVHAILILAEEYRYIKNVDSDGYCEMDKICLELLNKSL